MYITQVHKYVFLNRCCSLSKFKSLYESQKADSFYDV